MTHYDKHVNRGYREAITPGRSEKMPGFDEFAALHTSHLSSFQSLIQGRKKCHQTCSSYLTIALIYTGLYILKLRRSQRTDQRCNRSSLSHNGIISICADG